MTPTPTPPPYPLPAEFQTALCDLVQAQRNEVDRASVIYNIVRECYDAVRAIHGPDAETQERDSLGKVTDEAVRHEHRMDELYRPRGRADVPSAGTPPWR